MRLQWVAKEDSIFMMLSLVCLISMEISSSGEMMVWLSHAEGPIPFVLDQINVSAQKNSEYKINTDIVLHRKRACSEKRSTVHSEVTTNKNKYW